MLIIRCTRKLLNRLPAGIAASNPPPSTTKFGDWYGNPVGTKYRRLVLFVSEMTRLPVLIEAKDLKNSLEFRLRKAIGTVIANLDDIPPESIRAELDQMQDVVFAKTASRSVLGTINDYTFSIRTTYMTILTEILSRSRCGLLTPFSGRPFAQEYDYRSADKRNVNFSGALFKFDQYSILLAYF